MRVRKGDLLVRVEHATEALEASHLFLQYYRENAEYLERSYDFVERLGISRIKAETVDAAGEIRAALLERFARSREIASEPWSREGEKPATPHQFGPLPPVAAPATAGFVRVGVLADLPLGEGRAVHVGTREIALFRTGEREVHAIHARCPHANGPLADGILAGGKVTCPLHAWKVDVATGAAASPAGNCDAVPTYALELRGDELWLAVPAPAPAPATAIATAAECIS
jgi:nitrite reductase/ring-hydroxylating ferredoxin subunit